MGTLIQEVQLNNKPHKHTHTQYFSDVLKGSYLCSKSKWYWCSHVIEKRARAVREWKESDWALVIFGWISTLCSLDRESSHELLDYLTERETTRKRAGECKGERQREEVTQIPESQRVGQTPQTIKTRWPSHSHPLKHPSIPSVLSAGPVKASIHSLTHNHTP